MVSRAPNRKKQYELDDQIDAAWTHITNERMRVKVPEHQRQRANNPDNDTIAPIASGNTAVDSQLLNQLTMVNMTIWGMVSVYKNAGTVHYLTPQDQMAVFEAVQKYLNMWADRTQRYPDDDQPDMVSFILLDEFIESMHPEYELNCFIHKKPVEKPTPRGIGAQMKRQFSGVAAGVVAKPTFAATRYESIIKRFHENVWGGQSL